MIANGWARYRARFIVVIAALVTGLVTNGFDVPAGALLGAMFGAFLANLALDAPPLPAGYRASGKALLGTAIGATVGPSAWIVFADSIVVLLAGVAILIGCGMLIALVLVRIWRWSPATALLACIPGGLSEFASTAPDFGADTATVIAVHTVRVLAVLVIAPPLLFVLLGGIP